MSTAPPGPPTDSAPESPSAPTEQEQHGWAPVTPQAPPTPSPYAPPPEAPPAYAPPPAYGPPPTMAAPRRGRGGLIAIILVIVVLIAGGGGYLAAGFATANSKLNSSADSYNKVIDDQGKITDFFNNLSSQFSKIDLGSGTADSVQKEKSLYQQQVTKAQSSLPTVTTDDQTLANAEASLSQDSWLTVFSKSSLDSHTAKIEDLRAAVKIGGQILNYYVKYGTFYVTMFSAIGDLDAMSTALDNHDLAGANTAVQAMKSDLAKAQTEDVSSAGISTQMPTVITLLQAFATDFSNLLSAAQAGNQAGINAAATAVDADASKLDKFDFNAAGTEEVNFYKQLIDSYNAAIDKANKA